MRVITLLTTLVVLAHLAPSARADRALTIGDVLERARRANRDLVAARARVEDAQATVDAARAALLPTITVRGRTLVNSARFELQSEPHTSPTVLQPIGQLDAGVGAELPLLAPASWSRLRAARYTAAAAASAVDVEALAILEQTGRTFYVAAGMDELVKAQETAVTLALQTTEAARARVETGAASPVELTRAEAALVAARQELAGATRARNATYRALATLLDLDGPLRLDAAALADDARGPAVRPEIVQGVQRLAAARAAERAASRMSLPTISAFATGKIGNDRNFAGDRYTWAVGVQLDWQPFDGGTRRAARRRARAQQREAEALLSQQRDRIDDELTDAREQLATERLAIDAALRQSELARQTFELVRAQYDVGTSTQLELLAAQDALVASEVGVARARLDANTAELALRRAEGRLHR